MNRRTLLSLVGTVLVLVIFVVFWVELRKSLKGNALGLDTPTPVSSGAAPGASPTNGDATFTIQGVVEDAHTHAGIAGAHVVLVQDEKVLQELTAKDDGSFALDASRSAQRLRIRAQAPGYVEGDTHVGGRTSVRVALLPAVTISGRVVRGATSQEIEGAHVRCFSEFRISSQHAVTTNEQGEFRIDGCTPGSIRVTATHREFAAGEVSVGERVAGENVSDIEIALEDGTPVTGRVVDTAGKPQPEAVVAVFDANDPATRKGNLRQPWALTPVDAKAHFDLGRIAPGSWDVMGVTPDGRAAVVELALEDRGDRDIEIRLLPAAALAGSVVRHGEPVDHALVSLRLDRPTKSGPERLMTDLATLSGRIFGNRATSGLKAITGADGRFAFDAIAPGRYYVDVQHSTGRGRAVVETGTQDAVVELLEGGDIRGTIVQADSGEVAPVAGSVLALPEHPEPGVVRPAGQVQRGEFHLQGVPPGRYVVHVHLVTGEQLEPMAVEVKPELTSEMRWRTDEVVQIRLVTVHGRILNAAGNPVPSARIGVSMTSAIGLAATRPGGVTDLKGRFELQSMGGTGKIVVRHPDYKTIELPFDAGEQTELDLGDLTLERPDN